MLINFVYILQVSIKTMIRFYRYSVTCYLIRKFVKELGVMELHLTFGFAGKMTNFFNIFYSCIIKYGNGTQNWYFALLFT